jgi:hypothetical protein
MDFDDDQTPLLDEMSSQALETCSTAPVNIQAGRSKPGPSISGRRIIPETIQEEPDVSPKPSKADRDTVFPDKGLEGALIGVEAAQGETGKGKAALQDAPEGENGHSQPASDESSTDSDTTKHPRSDEEDVGEEEIDTRRSVQQEIDTLRGL